MRQRLSGILLALLFAGGFLVFSYPTISDQWNSLHQSRAIAGYEDAVEGMSGEEYDALWQQAYAYNAARESNTFDTDAFAEDAAGLSDTEYWKILNVGGNGVMGYLSIPKIDQKLPIYHGSSEAVLQIAVGHLSGTGLPVGGEGNHCVLSWHRGLPTAKLFTDLDRMEPGDKFYIHMLDQVLAYEVDQILPMIDKDDLDALTSAMQIVPGEDHVTLLTCTPYGINSHRLLVRGVRTEYHGEEEQKTKTPAESMVKAVQSYYMLYLLLVLALILLFSILIMAFRKRRRKSH